VYGSGLKTAGSLADVRGIDWAHPACAPKGDAQTPQLWAAARDAMGTGARSISSVVAAMVGSTR